MRDLSNEAKMSLGISTNADQKAKVFNPFFKQYDELQEKVRKFLFIAVREANSNEMRYILYGNHLAWCAARFMETGIMEGDIQKEFFAQNSMDFYVKDIGTIMPTILFGLTILGEDPRDVINYIDYDLWGIEEVAEGLAIYMYTNQKKKIA